MKSRAKGVAELNQFRKSLEYIEGLSGILSLAGYVYKKSREVDSKFSEILANDIDKLSHISVEMLDDLLEKSKNVSDIDEKEENRYDALIEFKKSQNQGRLHVLNKGHSHGQGSCSCGHHHDHDHHSHNN